MLEKIYIESFSHTDLNMYRCGIEDCSPGHTWGPGLRDHFLIHYVLEGSGTFHAGGRTYSLNKNQGFLICPSTITFYQADDAFPWSYAWVGFHGLKAEAYLKLANLTENNPVFCYDKDDFLRECLGDMIATKNLIRSSEVRLTGLLYLFLSQLIEVQGDTKPPNGGENRKEQYIRKAIQFIEMNYSRKINVTDIAHDVGLDRSYLYSLFTEYLSTSPQDFIISYRINKGCELMSNPCLTIGDISRSVGYVDPLLFSKTFKKLKGFSPKEYRKKLLISV